MRYSTVKEHTLKNILCVFFKIPMRRWFHNIEADIGTEVSGTHICYAESSILTQYVVFSIHEFDI